MEKQPLFQLESPHPSVNAPEPSLAALREDVLIAQHRYMLAWHRSSLGRWHKRIMMVFTAFLLFVTFVIVQAALADDAGIDYGYGGNGKVPLEAHIMSKCPDARDCLHDLILPAMQQVSDKVDFQLSYIGNTTDHDDGVLCKHGPEECLGNIIELCAAQLYPDPKVRVSVFSLSESVMLISCVRI